MLGSVLFFLVFLTTATVLSEGFSIVSPGVLLNLGLVLKIYSRTFSIFSNLSMFSSYFLTTLELPNGSSVFIFLCFF